MSGSENLIESLEAIGPLLARLEETSDPRARAYAQAIVRGVLDFHRAAITRLLEITRAAGPEAEVLVDTLARDDLVASMLVLHGLHPASLESRARAAIEDGCPNGWRVDHLDIHGAVVRVAFARTCDPRRAADAERVRSWAEDMLSRAAPDAEALDLAGELSEVDSPRLVPVERLRERRTLARNVP